MDLKYLWYIAVFIVAVIFVDSWYRREVTRLREKVKEQDEELKLLRRK